MLLKTQESYVSIFDSWLANFILFNRPQIEAFAHRDREKLYELTLPKFQSLQNIEAYSYHMHFHLPDGRSFLRMHKPENFGDDLRQIRPAVQEVQRTKLPMSGYEIGVHGAFYRVIHPVIYKDEYIGALEVGIKADEIVAMLGPKTGMKTAIFFSTPLWEKASGNTQPSKEFGKYTIVEDTPHIIDLLPENFELDEKIRKLEAGKLSFSVYTPHVLSNCFHESIGGIIALHDLSDDVSAREKFIIQSVVITSSLAVICIIFLSISFQKLIGNLENAKETQDKLIGKLNREIETRTEAEKALLQSEKQQRHILNSLSDTIFLLDCNFTVKWVNKSAQDMFPISLNQKCLLCIREQNRLPDENCLCRKAYRNKSIQTGITHLPPLSTISAESSWETISIPQLDEQENVTGVLVVLRNITNRLQAEKQVNDLNRQNRLLLEAAGEGIYGVDLEGNTTFMNPAAVRMTGFSEEEMIGNHQHDLLHHTKIDGSHYPSQECPVYASMKDKKTYTAMDELFWRKDGSSFPVEYVAAPVLENDEVIGAVVLFSDITERKTLESQLLHSQKMEAVGRLTGGISHDFNNLLTTILGYSEILLFQKENFTKDATEKIKMIHRAGKMAAALTRQLLAFSRKQVLEIQPINVCDILKKLANMLRRVIGEDIILELQYECPSCSILADTGQFEQIIMNIAINAKDAMPNGGRLNITTKIIEVTDEKLTDFADIKPGPYVYISISDSGEGMSKETMELIFEPFFTTKEKGKGTGLGLATVYGIINQHNGYITVNSSPGQGTTFQIYFPLAETQADQKIIPISTILPTGSETIMVVDDETDIRSFISDTLEPLGYTVLEAGNGDEALRSCQDHPLDIDLLITDVVMPGMSGKELAYRLMSLQPGIKTLFISGYPDEQLSDSNILKAGINFLPKPLTPQKVAKKVRKILNNTEDYSS
ncbi:MAG: PAS domain S-box protein [Desulfobulbaceae bacterium]|nr:PAS domain S-box protein [Desulfobulbaceae bacterium]